MADGRSRLVSVEPPDVLQAKGVAAGEEREGIRFVKNMCPSQGTMDIFVEPVLPKPEIVICGSSPVAIALADLGRRLGFALTACAPAAEQPAFVEIGRRIEGYALPVAKEGARYIVVSTQGRGDEAALKSALAADADYVAFVGSRRKAESLRAKLSADGVDAERLARVKAPAGHDLGAITPEEIALSILSEIVTHYRKERREDAVAVKASSG
jgi:xanthine dehydrogenase accessory factor